MANVLAALGGAAAGVANALESQREYGLKQQLLKQQILAAGGGPMAAPDPQDPNAPGGGSASGSNGGGAVGASSPAAALMSGSPMASLLAGSAAASGPPAGAGNTTQGGTSASPDSAPAASAAPAAGNATQSGVSQVPTNQADVINQARQAATGPSPSSTGAPSGIAGILNGAASKVGASGTPVSADPIGGLNSGLMASGMMTPGKMIKVGKIDGQDWGQPQVMPAQVAAARQAMLNASVQSGLLTQQGQQQSALQSSGQEFESGQSALSRAQQAGLAAEHEQLTRDLAKANNAVEYARIAAEKQRNEAEMAMLGQSKSDSEMSKIDADLKPIEQQLPAINKFQAITPEMAKSNPALAQQAIFGALQSGLGGTTFQSRLAKIAGAAPTASVPQIAERLVTTLASGQRLPGDQFQALQQEVALNKATLRDQHATVLAQDLTQYPMAAKNAGIKNRTEALFGPAPGPREPMQNDPKYSKDMAGYKQYVQDHNAWQTTSSK